MSSLEIPKHNRLLRVGLAATLGAALLGPITAYSADSGSGTAGVLGISSSPEPYRHGSVSGILDCRKPTQDKHTPRLIFDGRIEDVPKPDTAWEGDVTVLYNKKFSTETGTYNMWVSAQYYVGPHEGSWYNAGHGPVPKDDTGVHQVAHGPYEEVKPYGWASSEEQPFALNDQHFTYVNVLTTTNDNELSIVCSGTGRARDYDNLPTTTRTVDYTYEASPGEI